MNFTLQIPSDAFGNSWATASPSAAASASLPQSYRVLPLITSTPIVRAYLSTPYPTGLAMVATDGSGQTVTLPQFTGSNQGPSTGFFQVISVNATNPTAWHVVIRFPDSFKTSKLITAAISDVSGQYASSPLSFALASTVTTVNVKIVTANSDGRVVSNPPGIDCPGTCSFDFNGWSSVALSQSVLHNQTEFTGWQGNCTGTGNTCTLQPLNGITVAANANFKIHSSPAAPIMMCPAAPEIPGKAWADPPNCGTIPTNQGATLQCDAQGYFCCNATGGAPSPRCGGQNLTPVTCMKDALGVTPSNESLLPADQPEGCYVSDMFP
ncbi:MAG: hypothetical protein ACR2JE_04330 [Acidobacteriaceae bacterium]